jgi:hypothetical protein
MTMKIDYSKMDRPEWAIELISNNGGSGHLFQETTGEHTRYRVGQNAGGKTTYWQDASGTVTETKYIGLVPVEIVNIPTAIDYDDPATAYAYYGHI